MPLVKISKKYHRKNVTIVKKYFFSILTWNSYYNLSFDSMASDPFVALKVTIGHLTLTLRKTFISQLLSKRLDVKTKKKTFSC